MHSKSGFQVSRHDSGHSSSAFFATSEELSQSYPCPTCFSVDAGAAPLADDSGDDLSGTELALGSSNWFAGSAWSWSGIGAGTTTASG